MHRDPTLRKRNALVVPGVLLVLLCLVGIVYAQAVRPDTVECEDGKMVVFAGACRSATLLLVIPLALGALLIILGARIRGNHTCHLGHGTVATTTLAALIAAVALPLLAALALYLTQDPDAPYTMTYNDVEYGQARILGALAAAMALVLIPFLVLYIFTARPRGCCRDKGCFEPCFCDEDTLPPSPLFAQPASQATVPPPTFAPMPPPGETAQVTTTAWSGPPAREVQPLPPPPLPGSKLPAAPKEEPPKPLVHDAWPAHASEEPAASSPATWTETTDEPTSKEPAKGKPAKKAAAKKTRKVTRNKSK